MNILILGIGGPTPRSIASRIRVIYPDAKIIGTDINPKAIGFYMNGLVDARYVIPRAKETDYFECILKIINKESIDFAIVQPEAEVMAWGNYFKETGKYPCATLIPPIEHVESLMNKARMAELLDGTDFIPNTVSIRRNEESYSLIQSKIGYPCWIRASVGSGGLGALQIRREEELRAWLFIHKDINEFTVSEFLPGRHLANQMLYKDGTCLRNAVLHCVEYVMASIAPSKVTGNTSFGLLVNEAPLLDKCEEVMDYIQEKTGVLANGVYSFDLKEDSYGNLKVTEVNIRHMAYTGILAACGFDLVRDSIELMNGRYDYDQPKHHVFDNQYLFLRDVDVEPIILTETQLMEGVNVSNY